MEEKIRELSVKFRNLLETKDIRNYLPWVDDFPNGSCGAACILLAMYLKLFGIESNYCSGERSKDSFSHAWLECGNLVVDITADQFEDINEKVIVSREKKWYRQFKGQTRQNADINNYDEFTISNYTEAFNYLIEQESQI